MQAGATIEGVVSRISVQLTARRKKPSPRGKAFLRSTGPLVFSPTALFYHFLPYSTEATAAVMGTDSTTPMLLAMALMTSRAR